MIGLTIVIVAIACVSSGYRMLAGPSEADRAISGDLYLFGAVALIALIGVSTANRFTFDIVLIAALLGFLSAMSLARALTRGKR